MKVISKVMFSFASLALMVMAAGLILHGCWQLGAALLTGAPVADPLLSAVGYTVIAIAVFDVAKFLVEEEVLSGAERSGASEARKSLTKFVSTISIALFLEGLVTVFRVSADNVAHMIYPTFLLLTATLLIIGLGIYQKLSVTAEEADVQADVQEKGQENRQSVEERKQPQRSQRR
ncbi:MAG: GNAT family acetyltransferase [Beijerinckiaceae bacterium]|nr:GNAT family acetyltransferase [Beijerinckiaceae bacterium]